MCISWLYQSSVWVVFLEIPFDLAGARTRVDLGAPDSLCRVSHSATGHPDDNGVFCLLYSELVLLQVLIQVWKLVAT